MAEYSLLRIFGLFVTLARVKTTRVEWTRTPVRVDSTRVPLLASSLSSLPMYTVTFQSHKGWAAVLGLLGAAVGVLAPYVAVMPPKVAAVVGIAGAVVAAFSNKPGAAKNPAVTVDSAPTP